MTNTEFFLASFRAGLLLGVVGCLGTWTISFFIWIFTPLFVRLHFLWRGL
jgi:hypothetical protein